MGKRSDFERIPRDYYPTPREAVLPLLPHIHDFAHFAEPCAGDGALISHLIEEREDLTCIASADIDPKADFIHKMDFMDFDVGSVACLIITNPPWDRPILHRMIDHFSGQNPTWLLFDADWMHTRQSAPYMKWCQKIVSVGRIKWIPDSKMTGKDNCAWYLFNQNADGQTEFYGR